MVAEKNPDSVLTLLRENPRPLAFPTGRVVPSATAKSMPNEIAQKPLAPILSERFKALLKQRDDERRALYDDDVPPPSTEEIVQLYEIVLSELTLNLKPIITELTIIAGDQREHGKGIADAICDRILEVSVEQKLPSLYLLDSIVKNIGGEYVRYFSSRLPDVFCEAYRQVQPNLHQAMRHLFGTWSTVFPPSVLRKIEAQLQFSQVVNNQNQSSSINPPRASEAPRRTHGIHVNPKYLRQLENSTFETAGDERLDSAGSMGHTSFSLGANKMHQTLSSRHGRVPPSPSRVGLDRPFSASIDEFTADNSTVRIVERESPSHPAFDYGVGKSIARDEELIEWPRKQYSSDGRNQFPFSTNGHQRQSPRSLIDAYGSDKRQETSSNKPLVEQLDINGLDSKVVSTSWQNTEEEEFNWEDMSPTLVDHRRNNGFFPSSIIVSRERPTGIVAAKAAGLGQDTRSSWSSQSQLPPVDDPSVIAEDTFVSSGYGRGSLGQISGLQNQSLGSRHPHDAWKISHHSSNSSTNLINVRGRVRNAHLSPIDSVSSTEVNPYGKRTAISRIGSGLEPNLEACAPVLPASFRMRPPVNVHATRPPTLNPIFPLQKHVRSQFEAINASNTIVNQGINKSAFMSERLLDSVENNNMSKVKIPQIPNQLPGPMSLNQQNYGQAPQPQLFPSQDVREGLLESQGPAASQFSSRSSLQVHAPALSTTMSNSFPVGQFPLPVQNISNNSFHSQRGALPPLLPVTPAPSQMMPQKNASPYVSSQQPAGAFSGLINSLMAQGLIALNEQPPVQDSVGTEFNPDVLKVRHESAISALYADLPRQCTTCGLRFKCQEEHSSHMDWHVTKNRMSKNRKQKPSRKWFVSERMWLSGAEALGTEAVPGFLPTEIVEEKKDDEELAVPADEDQSTCALCGEPFDEFYSDETEEWMYRGAVYLNAPKGTVVGMDRSQFGPIVHAKCRSESSTAPSEEFGHDEGGTIEEGSQRKRSRS